MVTTKELYSSKMSTLIRKAPESLKSSEPRISARPPASSEEASSQSSSNTPQMQRNCEGNPTATAAAAGLEHHVITGSSAESGRHTHGSNISPRCSITNGAGLEQGGAATEEVDGGVDYIADASDEDISPQPSPETGHQGRVVSIIRQRSRAEQFKELKKLPSIQKKRDLLLKKIEGEDFEEDSSDSDGAVQGSGNSPDAPAVVKALARNTRPTQIRSPLIIRQASGPPPPIPERGAKPKPKPKPKPVTRKSVQAETQESEDSTKTKIAKVLSQDSPIVPATAHHQFNTKIGVQNDETNVGANAPPNSSSTLTGGNKNRGSTSPSAHGEEVEEKKDTSEVRSGSHPSKSNDENVLPLVETSSIDEEESRTPSPPLSTHPKVMAVLNTGIPDIKLEESNPITAPVPLAASTHGDNPSIVIDNALLEDETNNELKTLPTSSSSLTSGDNNRESRLPPLQPPIVIDEEENRPPPPSLSTHPEVMAALNTGIPDIKIEESNPSTAPVPLAASSHGDNPSIVTDNALLEDETNELKILPTSSSLTSGDNNRESHLPPLQPPIVIDEEENMPPPPSLSTHPEVMAAQKTTSNGVPYVEATLVSADPGIKLARTPPPSPKPRAKKLAPRPQPRGKRHSLNMEEDPLSMPRKSLPHQMSQPDLGFVSASSSDSLPQPREEALGHLPGQANAGQADPSVSSSSSQPSPEDFPPQRQQPGSSQPTNQLDNSSHFYFSIDKSIVGSRQGQEEDGAPTTETSSPHLAADSSGSSPILEVSSPTQVQTLVSCGPMNSKRTVPTKKRRSIFRKK